MTQFAADALPTQDFSDAEMTSSTADTHRKYRLDAAHPRVTRAEETLRTLRQRVERHLEQEVRLGQLYQGWQQSWTTQFEQIQRQIAKVEAHLGTWLPKGEPAHNLSVVHEEE